MKQSRTDAGERRTSRGDGAPRSSQQRRSAAHHSNRPADLHVEGPLRLAVRGFGFVAVDGDADDVFVPPPLAEGFLDGDVVAAEAVIGDDGRNCATELTLVDRTRTTLFGVAEEGGGKLRLRPDPFVGNSLWDLDVPAGLDVPTGAAVRCQVTRNAGRWSAVAQSAHAEPRSAAALRDRVLARFELDPTEPAMPDDTPAPPPAQRLRRDMRDLPTLTIDGESSRDLDDALSALPAGPSGAVTVFVHIADVADAVQPGSPLDDAAFDAATSVYLPGWNRPMLPRELSEGALSLLPGQDRNAITVEMSVDPSGVVRAVEIYESRICSDHRFTYTEAAALLDGLPGDAPVASPVLDTLRWLRCAAARIDTARRARGGVDSRRIEPERDIADIDGRPTVRQASPASSADELIERLMVAANEAVAGWLCARGLPGVFRCHDRPGADAAATLNAFADSLGVHAGFGPEVSPLALAAFETQLTRMPEVGATGLWEVLMGQLGRARYTDRPGHHFGLASDGYLHFTSPIRRYADLAVHRVVKAYLRGERHVETDCAAIAQRCDERAGTAKRAERAARRAMWLAAMAADNGFSTERRTGRVVAVRPKALIIALDGTGVEGTLPYTALEGRWDAHDSLLHAERSGSLTDRLALGQQMTVWCDSIDVEAGLLEFRSTATRAARRRPGRPPRHRNGGPSRDTRSRTATA